jgi:hypothetical protein
MNRSGFVGATENGTHRCTRKSAACEQGVCICRPLPQQERSISAVEYLSLSVKVAQERGLRSVPLPLDMVEEVLSLLTNPPQESLGQTSDPKSYNVPPPLEVTSVSFEEEQRRVAGIRPGYVGIFKKAALPSSTKRAMREAGRGFHGGM